MSHPPGSPGQTEGGEVAAARHDPLGLVRLRLALALLTVAVLPVAIILPVVRAVTDDTLDRQRAVASEAAERAAHRIAVSLEGTRRALLQLAGDGSLRGALAGRKAARAEAAVSLEQLAADPTVVEVALLDPDGAVVLRAGQPTDAESPFPSALGPSVAKVRAGRVAVGRLARPLAIELASPVRPGRSNEPSPGSIHALVSVHALLASLDRSSWPAGRSLRLVDEAGHVLGRVERPGDAASLTGTVIGLAAELSSSTDATGIADLADVGLEGWAIAVADPIQPSSLPIPALGLLAVLLVLISILVVWMARQVLRPAEELEASRVELQDRYRTAQAAALRDSLTGLGNHRAFQEDFEREIDQALRYRFPLSLLLIDLDGFKQVNDGSGHAVGDDLLAEFGALLVGATRRADRAYRVGGDEFAVLMPHTDASGAAEVGRRLLARALEERPRGRYQRPISFSAGIATAPEHATGRLQLYAQADAALYRSKRLGRTLVSTFDPQLDRQSLDTRHRGELSDAISRVIRLGALRAAYQPIVHLPTGRIVGYEGLIRPTTESGFESAAGLFAAAELTGRTLELDRACLETVLAGATGLGPDVLVSLNVSPRTLEAPEFNAGVLGSILGRFGIDPRRVILEVTERESPIDLERLRASVAACRASGMRVAADDIGAGNAGLRLLSQVRFDVVKIDLSLVQASPTGEPVRSVLHSLVDLAGRWGALVIAEGVETPEQLRAVREIGIEAAQGYLLGRPGPIGETERVDVDALVAQRRFLGLTPGGAVA